MPSKEEIAARIREGTRKRNEDKRRRQQLQREYMNDVRVQMDDGSEKGAFKYISCIFVTLIFVSFPLSEQVVDWSIVGLVCVLNLFWVLVLHDPSDWLNMSTMILSNLLLARWSPDIYTLPAKLNDAPKGLLFGYLVANLAIGLTVYYCYVERNWFRTPKTSQATTVPSNSNRTSAAAESGKQISEEELETYAQQRERMTRLDWMVWSLVVCNVAALIAAGIIPTEVVSLAVQGWMRVFQ